MQDRNVTFVYLDLEKLVEGPQRIEPAVFLELQYSLATLLAEIAGAAAIVVYTNRPDRYTRLPVQVENVTGREPELLGPFSYIYRAKPWVLLEALRKHGGICVFLDSDTFIQPGFLAAVRERAETSAIMHEVFWDQQSGYRQGVVTPLPHTSLHVASPLRHFFGNSGVIGLRSGVGEPILEDALHVIDETVPTPNWNRTLEQHAISEAIWLHGIPVRDVADRIHHYCSTSRKRYMHFMIKRIPRDSNGRIAPTRPCVTVSPQRVKLFQWGHDVRTFLKKVRLPRIAPLTGPV